MNMPDGNLMLYLNFDVNDVEQHSHHRTSHEGYVGEEQFVYLLSLHPQTVSIITDLNHLRKTAHALRGDINQPDSLY